MGQIKKILCLIFTLFVVFSSLSIPTVNAETTQEKIDRLNEQKKEYDKRIAETNKKISEIKGDISKQEDYAAELMNQSDDLQAQIDNLNSQISLYQVRINEQQTQITNKEKQINVCTDEIDILENEIEQCKKDIVTAKELLKERLRVMYVNGEASEIEVLFSADSLSSFLLRLELMNNSTKKTTGMVADINELSEKLDNDIVSLDNKIAELKDARKKFEEEKKNLEISQSEIKSSRNEEKEKQDKIDKNWESVISVIDSLDNQNEAYKKAVAKFNAEREKFDREIEKLLTPPENAPPAKVNPKGFVLPIERFPELRISSHYGMRDGKMHGGVDLAGVNGSAYGKAIYAADAGTVLKSGYHSSFGNYVLVEHKDGVATLYAHASKLLVSVGAVVKRGQKIAEVGNTGYSFGAHLHFEVHLNGKRTNPEPYLAF